MYFYPTISLQLLKDSIGFAKLHTTVPEHVEETIFKSRKSLLLGNNEPWIKKGQSSNFDVAMGSYDGAEVCELVKLFLLNDLSDLIGKNNVGLYRDDGLAVVDNASGHQMDKIRKQLHEIYKKYDLSITTEINLSAIKFLDVSLDLHQNTFSAFRKPGNKPLYINSKSNHSPTIIK